MNENGYFVVPSSPSTKNVNDWFLLIVNGHFGRERARNFQRIARVMMVMAPKF